MLCISMLCHAWSSLLSESNIDLDEKKNSFWCSFPRLIIFLWLFLTLEPLGMPFKLLQPYCTTQVNWLGCGQHDPHFLNLMHFTGKTARLLKICFEVFLDRLIFSYTQISFLTVSDVTLTCSPMFWLETDLINFFHSPTRPYIGTSIYPNR